MDNIMNAVSTVSGSMGVLGKRERGDREVDPRRRVGNAREQLHRRRPQSDGEQPPARVVPPLVRAASLFTCRRPAREASSRRRRSPDAPHARSRRGPVHGLGFMQNPVHENPRPVRRGGGARSPALPSGGTCSSRPRLPFLSPPRGTLPQRAPVNASRRRDSILRLISPDTNSSGKWIFRAVEGPGT